MRQVLLGLIAALAASAGAALAQPPGPMSPPPAFAPGGYMPGLQPMPDGGPGAPPGLFNQLMGDSPDGILGLEAERGYFSAETLVWFFRSMPQPALPLITSGTTASGGTVPNIGTSALFGGEDFLFNPLVGGRFTLGTWFRRNSLWGAEWSAFVTEQRVDAYRLQSGDQVVARPFIDADTGLPNSFLVSFPGFFRDDVTAAARGQIWGTEWNLQRKLLNDANRRITALFGFRYIDLHEDLSVSSRSRVLPGNITSFYGLPFGSPAVVDVADSFDTRNQYTVFQLGFNTDWRYRRWTFNWGMKLGLGSVYQTLDITGNSGLITTPGAPRNEVLGGLLAVSSNIGRYHGAQFVVIPEGKLNVAYRMFGNVEIGAGYNFTYFSRVIRPSDQIDPVISTTQIPTSANYGIPGFSGRPAVALNQRDFWVQGLNFSVTLHY
jgi:hypothetical protein